MKRTCLNCSHYHGCLREPDSQYHIHDYCDAMDRTMKSPMLSPICSFLDSYFADALLTSADSQGAFDDIESGVAGCYRFDPVDKSCDDQMKERFESNRALAIDTIDRIFSCGEYHNPLTGDIEKIAPEDVEYFNALRGEFERAKYE